MNKITFWRSNCTRLSSDYASMACWFYRFKISKSLTFLAAFALVLLCLAQLNVQADDTSDWPEPVYFPQRPAQTEPSTASPAGASKSETMSSQANKGHHRLWPFKAKAKEGKQALHVVPPKPSEQQADPPPSPYPLLRLPMPIVTDQGIVPGGIYLIKTEVNSPMIGSQTSAQKAPKATITAEKPLLLTRQNQVIARIPIHEAATPMDNEAETGTASPIAQADPKIPPPLRIKAELAADQRSIHLFITNGNHCYASDEYPVGLDLRHKLTF